MLKIMCFIYKKPEPLRFMETKWALAVGPLPPPPPPPPYIPRALTPAVKKLRRSNSYYQLKKNSKDATDFVPLKQVAPNEVNEAYIFHADSRPPTPHPQGNLYGIMQVIRTKYPKNEEGIPMMP